VTTANFGKPFKERFNECGRLIPGPPLPHYPNVAFTKFNPSDALTVYRGFLGKEGETAWQHRQVEKQSASLDASGPRRFRDLMPGYTSVNDTVRSMGYTWHPTSKVREAPDIHYAPQRAATASSSASFPSRCSSSAGRSSSAAGSRRIDSAQSRLARSASQPQAAEARFYPASTSTHQDNEGSLKLIRERYCGRPLHFI